MRSFRDKTAANGKGWLRLKFEELLRKKLEKEIEESYGEYQEFLQASLDDLTNNNDEDGNCAGYFSEDRTSKGETAIQEEVHDILNNREEMMRFKRADGSWNIRRFLFSKWTLKEGWDNPNVFVIAKLRSSGSEISKIQEVGRGLRLPFDENGIRQHQGNGNDFRLTYIIDYSEKEFAQKLVGEINADGGKLKDGIITEEILNLLVKNEYTTTISKAKGRLLLEDLIDEKDKILDVDKLYSLFPEDSGLKVKKGKITGLGMPERPVVKLNKTNFEKLRSLWEKVTKRYALHFEKVDEEILKETLIKVLKEENVFDKSYIKIQSQRIEKADESVRFVNDELDIVESNIGIVTYGEFLKNLNKRTHLPLNLIHSAIVQTRKGKPTNPEFFNLGTIERIVKGFEKKFIALYAQKFSYSALDFQAATSIFKQESNNLEFVDELLQSNVGEKELTDILREKDNYLYDKYVYDSDIEMEVLKVNPPQSVTVYGKLPKRSIKLPTYVGGTTSPDFVYAIQRKNEPIELHLIVETKSENMRMSDEIAVKSQSKAFEQIENIQWRMSTEVNDFERVLKKLTEDR